MEKLVGRALSGLLAVACILLVPHTASSQSATTGAIAGEVKDAPGLCCPVSRLRRQARR